MTSKDIRISKIKANIIQNEMNHSTKLKIHAQINDIAHKINSLIKKLIPSLDISESVVEFAVGYANINIPGEYFDTQNKGQKEMFERSLQAALSEIAKSYNNTLMTIQTLTKDGHDVEDSPEVTSLNKVIHKLKVLDPLSQVDVCGDDEIHLASFNPITLAISKPPKAKEQLINEMIVGLVISDQVYPNSVYDISGNTPIDVMIYTLENKHRFNARLSYGQIKSIVLLSSRISGNLTPQDGKKIQTLSEGFVIV